VVKAESSNGFGAVWETDQGNYRGRGVSGHRRGGLRNFLGCGCCGSRSRLHLGVSQLFDAMNVLVGDLPAKVTFLTALLHVLFEEDRAPRIRRESAGSRQKNISDTILYGDFAAQKLSKRRHFREFARGAQEGQ